MTLALDNKQLTLQNYETIKIKSRKIHLRYSFLDFIWVHVASKIIDSKEWSQMNKLLFEH